MHEVPVDLCYSQPSQYRLCGKESCIPWDQKCPCKADTEFRCSLGNCIPLELKCDGYKQCLYGEDEEQCLVESETEATEIPTAATTESFTRVRTAVEEGLSIPLVVVIASVCVFACVLMVILLYIFIMKKHKNNTSRESQSATVPLRKSYITSDIEAADSSSQSKDTYKGKTYISRKPERAHYQPVGIEFDDNDYQLDNYDKVNEPEHRKTENTETVINKDRENLAINPGAEIYGIDESRVTGLGKYTFKPRLKYMKSKPYHEIEEKDRDMLYVINSYKHCSGKSILPSTLTFDKDPEKFSDKFATDFLCSSTPRQPVKHLVRNSMSVSLESVTAGSDNEIT